MMSAIDRCRSAWSEGNLGRAVENRVRRFLRLKRVLYSHPKVGRETHSARRINRIFEGIAGTERYLEVGVFYGATFEDVRIPYRVAVDPNPRFVLKRRTKNVAIYSISSDEFFSSDLALQSFDVIFLDGLHTYRQTYRDLMNSLRIAPNAIIVIDDVIPVDAVSAMPDHHESLRQRAAMGTQGFVPWHGDVYKLVLCIADNHPELMLRTIVGDDNAQSVVWQIDRSVSVSPVSATILDCYDNFSYDDIFGSSSDLAAFRLGSEDTILDEVIRWRLGIS